MDIATKLAFICSAIGIAVGIHIVATIPATTIPNVKPAAAAPVTRLSASEEDTLYKFVRDKGYVCNHIVSSRRLLSEPGVVLVCESWTYNFHQKAGRWAITPRKLWGQ